MPNPVVNWNRGFKSWLKSQIYTGPTGTGIIVPNVDDEVIEWLANNKRAIYRVTSVDVQTNLSALTLTEEDNGVSPDDATNILLSSKPGEVGSYKRLYINNAVTPFLMAFHRTYRIYGSDAAYVKVFRGYNISNTGHIVSAMWDGNAIYDDKIPVVNLIIPSGTNLGIRSPQQAWCSEDLPTNEIVTVVVYDAADNQLSIENMVVVRTEFVHTINQLNNYIVDVELDTPYLSVNDARTVEIPINMALQSIGLVGKVRYADGTTLSLPVDGTRFSLLGIENYVASVPNMPSPLTLVYRLQGNEYGIGVAEPTVGARHIARKYKIVTKEMQNQYNVKLFVVPVWVTSPAPRWTLKYYLYSLERNVFYDATPFISYSSNAQPFDGELLNVPQTLVVAVNLQQVSNTFGVFRHIQPFRITLKASGSFSTANSYFVIEYTNDHFYGSPNIALSAPDDLYPSKRKLDISMNLTDVDDWLEKIYYPAEPLRIATTEHEAPRPTHIRLGIGNWVREIPIDLVLEIVRDINVSVNQAQTCTIEFIIKDGSDVLEMGMSSMVAKV